MNTISTSTTGTGSPIGGILINNDICDCERCPCCGKLRRKQNKYNITYFTATHNECNK